MSGRMDGWMDERTNGWKDGWMDGYQRVILDLFIDETDCFIDSHDNRRQVVFQDIGLLQSRLFHCLCKASGSLKTEQVIRLVDSKAMPRTTDHKRIYEHTYTCTEHTHTHTNIHSKRSYVYILLNFIPKLYIYVGHFHCIVVLNLYSATQQSKFSASR